MNSDKANDPMEKEVEPLSVSESDTGDAEFEPTVEMLVNDFDDERTLEEEELMEMGENQEEEVDNLTKEQDMPIEQLLAIYGGAFPGGAPAEEDDDEDEDLECDANGEAVESMDVEEAGIDESIKAEEAYRSSNSDSSTNCADKIHIQSAKIEKKKSDLSHLYPELDTNGDSGGNASARSLRSCSRHPSEDESEDGEEGSGDEEEYWRKTIMIGSSYQAQVPEGLQSYGAAPPYENEDKLLWEEDKIPLEEVEEYLRSIGQRPLQIKTVEALPMGVHTRDNEQALHLLLQCDYNVEEALRRFRMNPGKVASCMTLWSEEECRNFENGMKLFGKDFHQIQRDKVRTRSVGELVQFYYLWKKTERHDLFVAKSRIEKKKYFVHPGTTDYMDRFLDDGEGSNLVGTGPPASTRDYRSESPDGMHDLLYGNCPRGVNPPMAPTTMYHHSSAPSDPNAAATTDNSPPVELTLAPRRSSLISRPLNNNRLDGGSRNLSSYISKSSQSVQISRSAKRPHSPDGLDVNVSIAHSLSVRGNSSPMGLEPALGKTGAVAL